MKHLSLPWIAAVGTACLTGLTSFSHAADWPQYRGPHLNGKTSDKIKTTWPEQGLKTVWKAPMKSGFSSIIVADGKAFTIVARDIENSPQETVIGMDAESGKELWAQPIGPVKYDGGGDSGTSENGGGDGPRSTPSFADGKVYALSARLNLVCLDATSGKVMWSRDLMKDHAGRNISWQNAASPLIEDDLIYVAGGGEGQSLLAIHKKDGTTAWKGENEKMTHATPIVANLLGSKQVIFFTQSGLVSVVPNSGKVLWRYAFPYKVSTAASPVVDGDIVYCSAGYGVGSAAVRVAKSGDTWSATELWRLTGNKVCNHWSTPVAINGYLYGMFSFKEYGKGPVKCIDIKTGEEKWSQDGFGPGNVIVADGKLVALGDAGQLVLIQPDPKGYRELARGRTVAGKCWSTPTLSGGKLYVRSTKEGACIDLTPSTSALR